MSLQAPGKGEAPKSGLAPLFGQVIGKRALIAIVMSLAFAAALALNPTFDIHRIGDAVASADHLLLVPAVAVFLFGIWLRAVRWRLLLTPVRLVPVSSLFASLVIGLTANNVLPIRAGELVRAHELSLRESVSRSTSLATILVERVLDGVTLLIIIGIVGLLTPLEDWLAITLRAGTVIFAIAVAVLIVLTYSGALSQKTVVWLAGKLPEKPRGKIQSIALFFLDGMAALRKPRLFAGIILLSALAWAMESAVYVLVLVAFKIAAPPFVGPLVTATSNLAIAVPSSSGGVGPFEFVAVHTLTSFGVETSLATAYAIVSHATVLLPILPLGLWFLFRGSRRAPA